MGIFVRTTQEDSIRTVWYRKNLGEQKNGGLEGWLAMDGPIQDETIVV